MQDARQNLFLNSEGKIVYTAAALGIVYDQDTHTQRFFKGHSDDIVCAAMHPERTLVATGEMGRRPTAFVWDSTNPEGAPVAQLRGQRRAITHMAFSPNGKYLATIGRDDQRSLMVYDWEAGECVWKVKNTTSAVLFCVWQSNHTIVTGGMKHIFFWNFGTCMRVCPWTQCGG